MSFVAGIRRTYSEKFGALENPRPSLAARARRQIELLTNAVR
jgi:hypothetical protein